MTKLILKMPYIKSGKSSHKSYFVNYIATRSGVEIIFKNEDKLSTQKQKEIIKSILKDFPNSKNIFEYEDYKNNPTVKNASEFITISMEQNIENISSTGKYIDYIANRPNVEKITSHGLFNDTDENIALSKVAKEVAEHTGNIWTPIISLRREDAEKLGYDNPETWKILLVNKQCILQMHLKSLIKILGGMQLFITKVITHTFT